VIWNDRYGVLKLVQVDKLKEAWKKSKPRAAFISANNAPGLFQKVFLGLLTEPLTGPQYNIVGVLDSHSASTNRLEAILINDYHLRIPHDYPTGNPEPATTEGQQSGAQTEHAQQSQQGDAVPMHSCDEESEVVVAAASANTVMDKMVMVEESRGRKKKRSDEGSMDEGIDASEEPETTKQRRKDGVAI